MSFNLFDMPPLRSILFYPRPAKASAARPGDRVDGTLPIDENVVLGYRLHIHQPQAPLILYFHGNGEIASDSDWFVEDFRKLGLSLLTVDYRGYGWSTGEPRVSTLLSDVEPIMAALPALYAEHGLSPEFLMVMGRSLGSASAIHVASLMPERFRGLIVESGFAQLPPLMAQLGLPLKFQANLPDPIGNLRKMTKIHIPLLVIHGQRDTLIPPANGQALYDASPSEEKQIARLAGVGHNDLLREGALYFKAIEAFLATIRT